MSHDFKVCTTTKILAEFDKFSLTVREPIIVKTSDTEITWILTDGIVSSGIDPSTITDFRISFDTNIGSYEIYDCNVTIWNTFKWEGSAKGIVYNPKSISDKKLRRLY